MIDTTIIESLLSNTVIVGLVSDQITFPFAPSEWDPPYIVLSDVSTSSEFYETVNDTMKQIDIFVDKNNYQDAITIRDETKKHFLKAYVKDATMIYESDSNTFQADENLYRIIMLYKVINRI